MANKFAVGEFWDGNRTEVNNWIAATGNKSSAFDFPLRDQLKAMCDGNGFYNMRNLDGAGLVAINSGGAVTFVENHDTDHDPAKAIQNRKLLAYAFILTAQGYPCVFWRDWSTEPGSYGLKERINNLIWIHEKIANGGTQERWKDDDVFCFERTGFPNLLVGLNDNGVSSRTITVQTNFGANVRLNDYTGHAGPVWTDGNGRVTITIPANTGAGLGYVAYSRDGAGGTFATPHLAVTQEFAGADDLDIKPADNTEFVQVARIWVQAGKNLSTQLYWNQTDWTADTSIALEIFGPNNARIAGRSYTTASGQGATLSTLPMRTGWHTFRIRSYNTPSTNPRPAYWLKATYTAPQL
jgi:alpha-amylase